jgi:hypothetical protein
MHQISTVWPAHSKTTRLSSRTQGNYEYSRMYHKQPYMTMKTETTWTTLLASLFLSYTNADIIVLKQDPPYFEDSYDSSTLTTGWRIRANAAYTYTEEDIGVSIRNITFHTDSDCGPDSQVDLSDAKFDSSHGDANYAFDNNDRTSWDTRSSDFRWGYTNYDPWHIQYDNGPQESVQCIRIDLDVSGATDELETTIYIEGLVTSKYWNTKSWKALFRAASLTSGTNILDLNIICQGESRYWRDGNCDSAYNTKDCQYDGGDCGYPDDSDPPPGAINPIIITIVVAMCLVVFLCHSCRRVSDNTSRAQTPPNHGNLPTSPSTDDQREIRRERILTNIIHKVRSKNSAVRFVVVVSNQLHFVFSQQYP